MLIIGALFQELSTFYHKKLSDRREIARRDISVEILSAAEEQYEKSHTKRRLAMSE